MGTEAVQIEPTQRLDAVKRAILIAGILGTVVSAFYVLMGLTYPRGTLVKPGPGIYPLFVGFIFLAGSVGTIIAAVSSPIPGNLEIPGMEARRRILTVLGGVLGYMLIISTLGYIPAAAEIVLVTLHGMGMRSWPLKIGLAVAFALGSYCLFGVLLMVPMPDGFWAR
jgi:hypothetical protein